MTRLWWALLAAVSLAGCSGASLQTVALQPTPNACEKASAHDFWASAVTMVCYGANGKVIGVTPGTGSSAAQILSGTVQTALPLATVLPVAAK